MKSDSDIPPIALNLRDWKVVKRILNDCVPEYTVWAFGSRVTGTAKTFSDLDIVILAENPLTLESLATITDAFNESDLPIRVDVVDWAATGTSFREIIRQNYVVIQQGSENLENNT